MVKIEFASYMYKINQAYDYSKVEDFTAKDIFKCPYKFNSFKPSFKKIMLEIFNDKCAYCGVNLNSVSMAAIDHIRPKSRGGSHDIYNLSCCCKKCNSIKCAYDFNQFRKMLVLNLNGFSGIINVKQAEELELKGIDLKLDWNRLFEFERVFNANEGI